MVTMSITMIRKDEKGAAAVEFALCLPLLILILCGILEYGWYLTNQIVLANAVSAGARAGIKAKEWEGEVPELLAISATKDAFWISSDIPVTATIKDDKVDPPRRIKVKVTSLEYSPLTGYLPVNMIPQYVRAKAVMAFP